MQPTGTECAPEGWASTIEDGVGSMASQWSTLTENAILRGGLFLLGVALIWSYWPSVTDMTTRWSEDPRYAHGYLVPVFSFALAWSRWQPEVATAGSRAWGVVWLAAGAGLRLVGTLVYFDWLEAVSLLPSLAGLCLLLGGWGSFRRTWPAIAFLGFMLPLPYQVEMALGWPLQRIATRASAYALQILGMPALEEGNLIRMKEVTIGVVEACNGLGMLVVFFALATGVALVSRRTSLERIVVIASAIPIALIANVARITLTGVLHETVGERIANLVYHDLAGWLMMPLALALLGIELQVLSRLTVEATPPLRAASLPQPAGAEA